MSPRSQRFRHRGRSLLGGIFVYLALPLLTVVGEHPSEGTVEEESAHREVDAVVRVVDATHEAERSGAWGAPRTWRNGSVPGVGARVVIPHTVTVTIDGVFLDEGVEWLRVDGVLRFPSQRSTGLKVSTLYVAGRGLLVVGDAGNRVASEYETRLLFGARGDRDSVGDPFDIGGGLIVAGTVRIHGEEKQGFANTAHPMRPGVTRLDFAEKPMGWRIGDALLVPGTSAARDENEERVVVEVTDDGRGFVLDRPLEWNHEVPEGVALPVGNLTRNVRLESERRELIGARAHVMVMHAQSGTVFDGVAFLGLGRTRADSVHTVPELDSGGRLVEDSDANTLGRYALHFHIRTGARRALPPHLVRNCVIVDSPKFGLVNHGGHVVAEGNVTYRIAGSHFFAENGSEVGAFRHNLAVGSAGSGEAIKSRMYSYDLGHSGHGFWLQGGGVEVSDCQAYGHRDAAFIFHMKPAMLEDGREVKFAAENLVEPALADGRVEIDPTWVPIRFAGNVAAASGCGLAVRYHRRGAPGGGESYFEDSVFWNLDPEGAAAIDLDYSSDIVLRRVRAFGDSAGSNPIGVRVNGTTSGVVCEDLRIEGFRDGILLPRRGRNVVSGCYLDNVRNFFVQEALEPGRSIEIRDCVFGGPSFLPRIELHSRQEAKRDAEALPARWNAKELADISVQFERDAILYGERQLYFHSQSEEALPFAGTGIEGLDGRRGGEIGLRYGLALGGILAPPGCAEEPGIRGLIGPRSETLEVGDSWKLLSPRLVNRGKDYVVSMEDATGRRVIGAPVSLREGWNIVPVPIEGGRRSVLVCLDSEPPTFEWMPRLSLAIHPDDIPYGFMVAGRVRDRCGHQTTDRKYREWFRDLKVSADGRVPLVLKVFDDAGNGREIPFALEVTEDARRRGGGIDAFDHYAR